MILLIADLSSLKLDQTLHIRSSLPQSTAFSAFRLPPAFHSASLPHARCLTAAPVDLCRKAAAGSRMPTSPSIDTLVVRPKKVGSVSDSSLCARDCGRNHQTYSSPTSSLSPSPARGSATALMSPTSHSPSSSSPRVSSPVSSH